MAKASFAEYDFHYVLHLEFNTQLPVGVKKDDGMKLPSFLTKTVKSQNPICLLALLNDS